MESNALRCLGALGALVAPALSGCDGVDGAPIKEEMRELTAAAEAELESAHGGHVGEVFVHETSTGVLLTAIVDDAREGPRFGNFADRVF